MSGSVDPMQIKCFEPTGLVAVKVHNANGLPRKKGIRVMVGQDKPDPYVKLRIGAQAFRTRVIKNKASPVWPEDDPWSVTSFEKLPNH
jgi:Ca2+-dependent lipid-binding protein